MHINIAVAAGLNLLRGHKELLIQLLVKLIENQASLGGDKGAVCVGVFLVAHIHDGLTFFVDVVHHPHEILLVIPVVAVALRNNGLDLLQCALHNIVHNGNGNPVLFQLIYLVHHILADMPLFFLRKFGQGPVCALSHRINHLLNIKAFQAPVFFYDLNLFDRPVHSTVFRILLHKNISAPFFSKTQYLVIAI